MQYLPLSCPSIDALLEGGIEEKIITEIHGESGTGKTNMCLQAARECALTGKKVAFIDSEGVSLQRLHQISNGCDQDTILKNILFFSPTSQEEQEKMICNAIKIKEVKLIIVDTLNVFYRLQLEEDKEQMMRSLSRQIALLQKAAREKNLFVIVTEQVFTDKNGCIKPFTNRDVEHLVKTVLKIEKTGIGKRQIIIVKHRSQPEAKTAEFTISSTGLT